MLSASSEGWTPCLAPVASRSLAQASGQGVDRPTLSRICRMATEALALRAGVRLVLSELVASWGEQAWERLLVWPSNDHLMRRTGLSERALRDAFRKLVQLGLVVVKGSPNGKRYPIRNAEGSIVDAYGFDLSPLIVRQDDWARLLAARKTERLRIKHTHDEITVARRACEDALSGLGDERLAVRYEKLAQRTPRRGAKAPPSDLLDAWLELRTACEERRRNAGNGGENCRHIESNHESSGKACNRPRNIPSSSATDTCIKSASRNEPEALHPKDLADRPPASRPLDAQTLKDACPDAFAYGPGANTPSEIISLGRRLRAMLGAGAMVWVEAEQALGPLRAAIAAILVTQLYEDDAARHGGDSRIRNPGGYLRTFARMVHRGRIDIAAELMTMQRRRLRERQRLTGGENRDVSPRPYPARAGDAGPEPRG